MNTSKLHEAVGGAVPANDKTAMCVCAPVIRSGKTAYFDRPPLPNKPTTVHHSCFGTVDVSDVKAAVSRLADDVYMVGDQLFRRRA